MDVGAAAAATPQELCFWLKTISGRKFPVTIEASTSVLAFKAMLREKEGHAVEQIRIVHRGHQLADDRTLGSYEIPNGTTMHMVQQLKGGGF